MRNIQLDPEDLLVTIDVSSLYTNIPHTEGIAAINRMMEETDTDTLLRIFISNLAYQVLTKISSTSMDNYMNKPKEQQWEPEWHLIMLLSSCITWKQISYHPIQSNQRSG